MAVITVMAAITVSDASLRILPQTELLALREGVEAEIRRRSEVRRDLIIEHESRWHRFRRGLLTLVKGGRSDAA
jgi:hypothetical protein